MIEYIQIITSFILLASLIVAILQLRQLYKQIKANHDWHRRVTALRYSFSEDPHLREIRAGLDRNIQIFTSPAREIALKEIQELEKGENLGIRADIQFVLGRLESMCVAIDNSIVDEKVCKDLMRGAVIRYFRFFRQYIEDIRSLRNNPKIYHFLQKYAQKWGLDDMSLEKRLPTA